MKEQVAGEIQKAQNDYADDGLFNDADIQASSMTLDQVNAMSYEDVVKLLQTENDFTIHGYTFSKGDNELREKIIQNLNETYGTNFTVDNIFITCGATPAITASIRSLVHSLEDEIIFFAPYYPEYIAFSKASPCTVVEIPPDIPDFQINMEKFEKELNEVFSAFSYGLL